MIDDPDPDISVAGIGLHNLGSFSPPSLHPPQKVSITEVPEQTISLAGIGNQDLSPFSLPLDATEGTQLHDYSPEVFLQSIENHNESITILYADGTKTTTSTRLRGLIQSPTSENVEYCPDTRGDLSLISIEVLHKHFPDLPIQPSPTRNLTGIGPGPSISSFNKIPVTLTSEDIKTIHLPPVKAYIVENLSYDLLLGID